MRTPRFSASFLFRVAAPGVLASMLFGGAAVAATHQVEVGQNGGLNFVDDASHSSTSTVHVGDTVTWVWNSGFHTATSGSCSGICTSDGQWDSGEHSAPFSFSRVFNAAGNFPYFCTIHGQIMSGMVVVQQASSPPGASFKFLPKAPQMGTAAKFTDTSTGSPTSWSWNFGDPASGSSNTSTLQDPSHVFAAAGTYTVTLTVSNSSGSTTTSMSVTVAAGGGLVCSPDATTLCLGGGRFMVQMHWTKTDGSSGGGNGVKLTDDSGYFWFFDPSNIESVIKVLSGCAIDNAYWVFAAGLTNVQVDLTVTDTQTGAVYENRNPQGAPFVPIQSTTAFPTSCP